MTDTTSTPEMAGAPAETAPPSAAPDGPAPGPTSPAIVPPGITADALGEQVGRVLGGTLTLVASTLRRIVDGAFRAVPNALVSPSGRAAADRALEGEGAAGATGRAEVIVRDAGQQVAWFAEAARGQVMRAAARAREELEDVWAEAQMVRRDLAHRAASAPHDASASRPDDSGGDAAAVDDGSDFVIVDSPPS